MLKRNTAVMPALKKPTKQNNHFSTSTLKINTIFKINHKKMENKEED